MMAKNIISTNSSILAEIWSEILSQQSPAVWLWAKPLIWWGFSPNSAITSISCCLVGCRHNELFVEPPNNFESLADIFAHASLMAAFFWLNSLGYYIWKTFRCVWLSSVSRWGFTFKLFPFRSRNVFLRVTDGKKYCLYSGYAWGCTLVMASLGVFSHFFLDTPDSKKSFLVEDQETIGWLGRAIFFTPIISIMFANTFFYISTQNLLNSRMSASYGRIHYKLKAK